MLYESRASQPPSSAASPPSPGETVLNNESLLNQILVWLPPRSILKFKSVSKLWLALLTSPDFVPRRQSSTAISALCFGLTQPGSYGFINLSKGFSSCAPFKTLDFAHDPFGIRILNSCNGLILCSSNHASRRTKRFYVYNPTTNKSTTLPDLTLKPKPKPPAISGASLAFDPSISPHYKVICVIIDHSNRLDLDQYEVVIYSSETRDWKPCGEPFTSAKELEFTNGVFWDRSVHWLSFSGDSSLRFDVEQEQLRHLPMPPPMADEDDADDQNVFVRVKSRRRFFGQSGDHLHLVEIHESKPLQFEVFEVEPDYSRWFVKYKVDLSPVGDFDGKPNSLFNFLGLVREQEDDDESYLVLMLPRSHMAVRYKLKDGSLSKICDLNPEECTVSFSIRLAAKVITPLVYPFIESLASV